MSWLEEAEAINKQKKEEAGEDILYLDTEEEIERFKEEIKAVYEQATDREINRGIDQVIEKYSSPYSKKEILYFMKQFVED